VQGIMRRRCTLPPTPLRLAAVLLAILVVTAAQAQTTTGARRVLVVPMRYAGPPGGASEAAVDAYRATLPKVTTAAIAPVMQEVARWFARETYGAVTLDVALHPLLVLDRPAPGCDLRRIADDARAALDAAPHEGGAGASRGVDGYAAHVYITTYSCWQSHGATSGTTSIMWNTYPDSPGKIAHELGHAFGLEHSSVNGNVYGDGYDQMGTIYSTLLHLSSLHKAALGALRPLPCRDAVLRPLERYADAIGCGRYFVEYHEDGIVAIYARAAIPSRYGPADSARVAVLEAGQRWTEDAYTFEHRGQGRVVVKTTR
jgi:hypothetical protein